MCSIESTPSTNCNVFYRQRNEYNSLASSPKEGRLLPFFLATYLQRHKIITSGNRQTTNGQLHPGRTWPHPQGLCPIPLLLPRPLLLPLPRAIIAGCCCRCTSQRSEALPIPVELKRIHWKLYYQTSPTIDTIHDI